MLRSIPSVVVLGVALIASCKPPPEPSPQYQEAKQLFEAACADKPDDDDCWGDERLRRAEGLLREVTVQSMDFGAALILTKKLEDGRAAYRARMAEEAEANKPRPEPVFEGFGTPAPAAQADAATASAPAAQSLDDFRAKYDACVEKKLPFRESGPTGKSGDSWGVAAAAEAICADKFPELAGKLFLFADGSLLRTVTQADATAKTVTESSTDKAASK